ncbi:MAG: caspase family protein, partial [Planctomycetaceae bacterium]
MKFERTKPGRITPLRAGTARLRMTCGAVLAAVLLAVVAAAPARAEGGRRYALLVGVQFYEAKSNLRELKYTEHDVEELAQVLQASGWHPDNIVLMTQSLGARQLRFLPTGENIRRELNLLLSDLEPTDTLLVAFSGHGIHLSKEKQSYFCPIDADLKNPATLIALESLYQSLKSCRAGHKILLCDACRDDPALGGAKRPEVALESLTRPELDAAKGSAAFFSCSPGEVSYEHEDLKHGVFFHSVIDGLSGKADLDKDSEISLLELEFFVRKNVTDFVRARFGVKQRPEMLRQGNDVFPLLALPGQSGAPAESPDSSRR